MSENGSNKQNTTEILSSFAEMLISHQKASEDRQIKSDERMENWQAKSGEKMDTLAESINKLAQLNIEQRRDTADTQKISARLEDVQRVQGKKMATMSDTLLVVEDRQNDRLKSEDKKTSLIYQVIGGVAVVAIILWLGLK